MPSIDENRAIWASYDWTSSGNEWSRAWGSVEQQWAHTYYSRIAHFLPRKAILEIATGYGRWTRFLLQQCDEFYGIDLTRNCITACRDRFRSGKFLLTDGKTIPNEIRPQSIDFVFSADSLVHADANAIAGYLHGLHRVMSDGAVGLIHHSNMGDLPRGTPNLHMRDSTMSATRFRDQCNEANVACLSQELINWGQSHLNDCFSLIAKIPACATKITENRDFSDEICHARFLAVMYHPSPAQENASDRVERLLPRPLRRYAYLINPAWAKRRVPFLSRIVPRKRHQ
jgi:SAM-dependent methyltransferase